MPTTTLFLNCVYDYDALPVLLRVTNPPGFSVDRWAMPTPDISIPTRDENMAWVFTRLMENYPGWSILRVSSALYGGRTHFHVYLTRDVEEEEEEEEADDPPPPYEP